MLTLLNPVREGEEKILFFFFTHINATLTIFLAIMLKMKD